MMRLSSRLLVAAAAVGTSVLGSEQLSLLRRTTNDGTDHKTDELPRGAKSGNDKFMEALVTITDEQVRSLLCRDAVMGSKVYMVIILPFPMTLYRK